MDPSGHVPVLAGAVTDVLEPARAEVIVDCTIGLGGHSLMLLGQAPDTAQLIGIDLDPANLRQAKARLAEYGSRCRFFHANFADLPEVLSAADVDRADAVLADLGVASTQLDDPARGLSFQADGPLDMRMDPQADRTAEDIVNELDEADLADVIYQFGEERYSRRIARRIVQARSRERITTTGQLSQIVSAAVPSPARRARRGVHPATRTFQALRIAVNRELESLDRLLEVLPTCLNPGGRAAIISFHSLEDRRVKRAFRALAQGDPWKDLTRKPLTADPEEVQHNPRSRSAKLRAIRREKDAK